MPVIGSSNSPTLLVNTFLVFDNVSCASQNDTCVVCSNGYNIQNGFLLDGEHRREFVTSADGFSFHLTVPICGSKPTSPNFNSADIYQSKGPTVLSMGTMTTGLRLGTFDGLSALSASYTGGAKNSGCGGIARNSEVFLVCDPRYTSAEPGISVSEATKCSCKCLFFSFKLS
jgi:hypothetical protein